jgi:HEAT repeat protein
MNPRSTQTLRGNSLAVGAAAVGTATAARSADSSAVARLVAEIQSPDENARAAAWQGAGPLGAPAVQPLAKVMAHSDFEIARAAKRALWKIVRHAGSPRAGKVRKAVQAELVSLLRSAPLPVRREALWMLSEIGDDGAVGPLAGVLGDAEVREDARCALERVPGAKASRALEHSLTTAPEDFRPALANSLRVRGRKVAGYPSRKLAPVKQTTVPQK